MKAVFSTIRARLYDGLRRGSSYPVRQWFKRKSWFTPLAQRLFGNDVYSRSYFEDVERLEKSSVEHMAEAICALMKPKRVIDVGCGPGHLMQALHARGVDVHGVDVGQAALDMVRERGLVAEPFDLTVANRELPGGPYDLAVSCEVAEHLEERFALTFVEKLTKAAPRVYLTAAEPSPSRGVGLYHVNEQPNAYWIGLMNSFDYQLDDAATNAVRSRLDAGTVIEYLRKPMIFVSRHH